MPTPDPDAPPAECPECHSRNVLEIASNSTIASLYCLACGHLFATELPPDASAAGPPAGHPPPSRALRMFLYRRAA